MAIWVRYATFSMLSALLAWASSSSILNAYLFLSFVTNGIIAILVCLQRGQTILGKDQKSGNIPRWSYILFFTYYIPTYTSTWLANNRKGAEAATEVYPGYYIGGCNSYQVQKRWAVVVDLCCEWSKRKKWRGLYITLSL